MSRNASRSCRGTTTDGRPCRSPVVGTDGWCDAHRPGGGLEEVRRRAEKGGAVTKEMFRAGLHDLPPLRGPEDATEWLERVGRAVALGRLSASAGQAVVRAVKEWREAHETTELAERLARLEKKLDREDAAVAGRVPA